MPTTALDPKLRSADSRKQVVLGGIDRRVTDAPHGHILTNANVWSADSRWLCFDARSDAGGTVFDSDVIQAVNVRSGQVKTLYTAPQDAKVGVCGFRFRSAGNQEQLKREVVFIHGPEKPSDTWTYSPTHRRGVVVDVSSLLHTKKVGPKMRRNKTPEARNLDARSLLPPFTPGALRGGTHVHQFSPDGVIASST